MKTTKNKDHDEKTCFRCRLHALWKELHDKHGNESRFILMCMAEASGSILSELSITDAIQFMMSVEKFIEEDAGEGKFETKH
jgi:hypothetical protein